MKRAGLIVNPRSGKGRGKGMALAAVLRRENDIPVCIIEDFTRLTHYLDEMAAQQVTDLFISSGDGTIQAIQTDLAERQTFTELPRLCLLPHGSTNMTAADLGFHSRNVQTQIDFIKKLEPKILRQRPTLRAVNPADGKPRHGMFLGTGSISEATAYCQRVYNDNGVLGNWATFSTLLKSLGQIVFAKANPDDPHRLDRPYPLTIENDGVTFVSGERAMMLSTTLKKLVLGTKPFWDDSDGPIRTSVFPYPLPNLLRWLPTMMYGSKTAKAPTGAMSFSTTKLSITSPVSYVIDGEFFNGPEGQALQVETGPLFTYLVG